jgi:flavodoxin
MRALVVYESMYGNTHVIASNIADGLRPDYEVTLVPVAEATWDLVAHADLLVTGAPTHMHGLSSRSTRRMATQAAAKDGSGLRMATGAGGPGCGSG